MLLSDGYVSSDEGHTKSINLILKSVIFPN